MGHSSPTKKRKSPADPTSPAKKRAKKHTTTTTAGDGQFYVTKASLTLSIPPIFASNPRVGVQEMLDSMVMRYIPAFRGVVLSHSNLAFTNKKAIIKDDCPFLICDTTFDATIWSPKVGMKLIGKVNVCSPDHVSLLIHRTFNASIPRKHLPTDDWQFEYGPTETDPQPDPEAETTEEVEVDEDAEPKEEENTGRWVNTLTGEKLGGEEGYLEFTVIGLTVANEMLSLQGSIHPHPFSPVPVRDAD